MKSALLPIFNFNEKKGRINMKAAENTIMMLGEKMEVFVGAGCLSGCSTHIASRLPAIVSGLCKTLSKRQVARTFMHHVRIGDTVALVDRRSGCAFRFTAVPPEKAGQVFYLVNSRLWQRHSGRNRLAVAA